MPVFGTARRGLSYSEALLEAAAVAPTGVAMLETFEIYHPDGTPAGALYLVANPEDFAATKESTADRDPSTEVTFVAAPIVSDKQDESDTAEAPMKALRLSNVSGIASAALRLARGSLEPWQIIERLYASNDPAGPAMLPVLSLLIERASIVAAEVAFTAGYGDPSNVSVPAIKFRRTEYPTLVQ